MFQNRDDFLKIWKQLEEKQKYNIVNNSVNIIDSFDDNVFKNNSEITTVKNKKLSHNELLFKFILQLNNYQDSDLESQQDAKGFKLKFKEKMKKLMHDTREEMKPTKFVKSSISFNLQMGLDINQFFQNYLVKDFYRLYIEKQFQSDTEKNSKAAKKKKRKRNRKNKNKKENDQKLRNDSKQNNQQNNNQQEQKNKQQNPMKNLKKSQNQNLKYKEDEDKKTQQNQNVIQKSENSNLKSFNLKTEQSKIRNQIQKQNECQNKKEEQYSTANSLLNQKNFEISKNTQKIFQKNFSFKKLSSSKQQITKNKQSEYQNTKVEVKLIQDLYKLQLSQESQQEDDQQGWCVLASKNKKQKKNKNKRKKKKQNSNQNQNQKVQKSPKIQNIQVSKPMNYLTKLNKWNDNEENNIEKNFLFQQKDLPPEQIHHILRQKIQKNLNQKLNKVLNDLIEKIQTITENQEPARTNIKQRIKDIVRNSINLNQYKNGKYSIQIQAYGSYHTKILTPFSDMDLYIQFPHDIDKNIAVEYLKLINQNLTKQKFVKESKDILTASIPVIKILADPSIEYKDYNQIENSQEVKVDLTINLSSHNLFNSSYLTTDFIKSSCTVYKSLQKNMIFLKYFCTLKQINNSYLGGLNSYGMSLMYIAFLERIKQQNNTDLFHLLLEFFNYYGQQFDSQKMVIDLGFGMSYKYNPFISKCYYSLSNLQQIVINDPTVSVFSNVTQTCTSWKFIQQLFAEIHLNYQKVANYLFDALVKQDLKKMTKDQFQNKFDELLQNKELCFQNIFQCDEILTNPSKNINIKSEENT